MYVALPLEKGECNTKSLRLIYSPNTNPFAKPSYNAHIGVLMARKQTVPTVICGALLALALPVSAPAQPGFQTRPSATSVAPGGDQLGFSVAGAGDLDLDGYPDIIVGAPLHDSTGGNAGAVFVYSGQDGRALFMFVGEKAGDNFGASVANSGDVNGDGVPDILIGAPRFNANDSTFVDVGKVYIYSGADGTLLRSFNGVSPRGRFGSTVAGIGDVNADGHVDIAVGEYDHADTTMRDRGAAFVYSGTDGGELHLFLGAEHADRFGMALDGAGDVDGDGSADIVIGAYRRSVSGISAGCAYLFSGRTGDTLRVFNGDAPFTHFGYSVAGVGDVNRDGRPDLAIGARFHDGNGGRSGLVYIYSGADGALVKYFYGATAGEQLGTSVAGAGDVNGDGTPDIIAGSALKKKDGKETGAAYVFSIHADESILNLAGESPGDLFGISVAKAGDVDKDAHGDIIVGACANDEGGKDAGRAYVYSGGTGNVLLTFTGTSAVLKQPARAADTTPVAAAPPTAPAPDSADTVFHMPEVVYDSTEVDSPPLIRRSTAAKYPESAKGSGLVGYVKVRVLVMPDGSPGLVEIADDAGLGADFRSAATDNAKTWLFVPATKDDKDVPSWALFPIGFQEEITDSASAAVDSTRPLTDSASAITPPDTTAQPPSVEPPATPGDSVIPGHAYELAEVDVAPVLTGRVEANYPPAAAQAGDTGTVTVRMLVYEDGIVREVEIADVTKSDVGFEDAAVTAAKRWTFEPGRKQGELVRVWVSYPITFHLGE